MGDSASYSMALHLPGLLQILGEHLYSDPRVALREALQNAHDSCRRRAAEAGEEGWQPGIELRVDAAAGCIEIADQGSGLTAEEVREFLATIGRSYTGELRGSLEFQDLEAAEGLIGQFGLGLLSGFLLADRLELTTRSFRPGSATLRWTSDGSQEYRLEQLDEEREVGSTLRLHLKPTARFLLDDIVLAESVREFVRHLEIPIRVDGGEVLSGELAPWHREDPGEQDWWDFVRDHFGVDPLTVLPLRDCKVEAGGSGITVPLRGCLFVPPASVTSLHEYGDVRVYVRRMLLSPRERDLLPPWARFVSGVVESPRLRPTVSRESLRQDDVFLQVQEGIARQLLLHLRELAQDRPDRWRELVLGHNDLLKGWALKEGGLFEAVADLVHFPTSRGRLRLPEIRAITGDRLYYFTEETSSNQEKMLYEAAGLLVIDASRFAEVGFLERYAARHPEVRLEQLRPGAELLFETASSGRGLPRVVEHFERRGSRVRCVEFEPRSLPALMVFPPEHDRLRRVQEDVADGELSGPLSELLRDFVERRSPEEDSLVPVLHVNARSPLMQELERRGPASRRFGPALDMVLQSARFFAGKSMSAAEGREAFEAAMLSLFAMLDDREEDAAP